MNDLFPVRVTNKKWQAAGLALGIKCAVKSSPTSAVKAGRPYLILEHYPTERQGQTVFYVKAADIETKEILIVPEFYFDWDKPDWEVIKDARLREVAFTYLHYRRYFLLEDKECVN